LTKHSGHVRITDVSVYPNLSAALGHIVPCVIEEQVKGCYLYHVKADSLLRLGCDLEGDLSDFPFYKTEAEVVNEGEQHNISVDTVT
jgi:hypothetical protein